MKTPAQNSFLRFVALAAAVLLLPAARPAPIHAAPAVAASLDLVPADAAFYSAMLRNREQYDAIVKSRAWEKLKNLPYVQIGLALYTLQTANPDSPAGKFDAALRDPDTKKSLDFLAEMVSDEIFVYGGHSTEETIELLQRVMGTAQLAAATSGAQGKSPGQVRQAQGRAALRALSAHIDRLNFPELVVGFKIKNKAAADEQLDKLDLILQQLLTADPIFQNRLKREKVGEGSYITLTLDGQMVPWDRAAVESIRNLAATPADGDALIARLKKMKLVISLGRRDDFVLLAIGPSTDVLAHLGGGAMLRTRPEMAAMQKFADRRIVSVGYASQSLNRRFSANKADIERLAALAKGVLPAAQVPAELREQLEKDIDEMAGDLKSIITEVGATASVSFLTPSGYESYDYDWSEHPEIDSSQPLDLLKHVGENPIVAVVGRTKATPLCYDWLAKWVTVGLGYAEKYAAPTDKKERKEFDRFFALLKPYLKRLDKATRDSLLPALADGQSGLVIDARFASRQFIKSLPATEKPLPMLEPAIVIGVSDAAKLKAAFAEYYSASDEFVEGLKKLDDKNSIPKDFKLPRPKEFHTRQGALYGYTLPADWGLDSRIMPNAGLSDHVAVLSLTGRHTQRLLTESTPTVAGQKLPLDQPRGAVAGVDFAAFVDALTPWVNLAIDEGGRTASPEVLDNIRLHTKTVLEVLKVFRGSVAETWIENKATVTHSRTGIRDIGESDVNLEDDRP